MIMCNMTKIFKLQKYDKTQYDKHFGILYHIALSKYDKKKHMPTPRNPTKKRENQYIILFKTIMLVKKMWLC